MAQFLLVSEHPAQWPASDERIADRTVKARQPAAGHFGCGRLDFSGAGLRLLRASVLRLRALTGEWCLPRRSASA